MVAKLGLAQTQLVTKLCLHWYQDNIQVYIIKKGLAILLDMGWGRFHPPPLARYKVSGIKSFWLFNFLALVTMRIRQFIIASTKNCFANDSGTVLWSVHKSSFMFAIPGDFKTIFWYCPNPKMTLYSPQGPEKTLWLKIDFLVYMRRLHNSFLIMPIPQNTSIPPNKTQKGLKICHHENARSSNVRKIKVVRRPYPNLQLVYYRPKGS